MMNIESMRKDFEARFPVPNRVVFHVEDGYIPLGWDNHATDEIIEADKYQARWEAWKAVKEQAAPCVWTEDECGAYETRCGNLFEITDGTPEDNNMRFCPYCGGELAASLGAK